MKNFKILFSLTPIVVGIIVYLWHSVFLTTSDKIIHDTTSNLKIQAKQHSNDYKQQWIVANDPNNSSDSQLKVLVRDPMVWNLIQVGTTYFTSYSQHSDGNWILDQISKQGDSNALR